MAFIPHFPLKSPHYEMCDLLVLTSVSLVGNDWNIYSYAYWPFLFPLLWIDIYLTLFYTRNRNFINFRRLQLPILIELHVLSDIGNKQWKLWSREKGSMRWALQQKLICKYQHTHALWIPIYCLFHICKYSPPVHRLYLVTQKF